MKSFMFSLLLLGCANDPIETRPSNNKDIPVELLFVHDGCSMYRFYDAGHLHYYARCALEVVVESSRSESSGENTQETVKEEIATHGRK